MTNQEGIYEIRLEKKKRCSGCRKKMVDGTTALQVKRANGKTAGIFCQSACIQVEL